MLTVHMFHHKLGVRGKRKKELWSELDDIVVVGVSKKDRVVIGTNFNGDAGEGNRGDEEVMVSMIGMWKDRWW